MRSRHYIHPTLLPFNPSYPANSKIHSPTGEHNIDKKKKRNPARKYHNTPTKKKEQKAKKQEVKK